MEITKVQEMYIAEGFVTGTLCGGGTGSYPARRLADDVLEVLVEEVQSQLESGELDSGFGFEQLIKDCVFDYASVTFSYFINEDLSKTDWYQTDRNSTIFTAGFNGNVD